MLFVTGLGPELEELMVEGFLLQVTLPETEQLYRYLLYKLAPLPSHSPPSGNNNEQDQQSPRGSPQHNKVVTIPAELIYFFFLVLLLSICWYLIVIFMALRRMEFPVPKRRQ